MKLALECPTSMLKDIQPLADFDWILAHLVLADKEYAEYYKKSRRFKVLDNSCNELLEPLDFGDILEAMDRIDLGTGGLVVAPDYLGSYKRTFDGMVRALGVLGTDSLLPVVQGSNLDEVLNLLKELLDVGFNRVAVPYDILSSREDSSVRMANRRLQVVNSIINKVPIGFEIHLLGMTTIEELTGHNKGWVKSIDTGVPVLLGMKGYAVDRSLVDKSKPTMDQMEAVTSVDPEYSKQMIYYNIAYLRKVLNAA